MIRRSPTSGELKAVALVVVCDPDRMILLVRSSKRAERWELPGGALEADESPMDAARREVLEETGVSINELQFIGLYFGSGDHLLRIAFGALVDSAAPRSIVHFEDDILEARWFYSADLPKPMPVLARRMIDTFLAKHGPELATIEDDSELT